MSHSMPPPSKPSLSPDHLSQIQTAIQAKDFPKAIKLIQPLLAAESQLPNLMLLNIYTTQKDWKAMINTAESILNKKDELMEMEVATGCWSAWQAAYLRAAQAWEQQGDKQKAEVYRTKWTKSQQDTVTDLDQSLHWKQVGNDHFNKQEYEEAKKCYIQAIQLDKSNEVLFANLSHTYLKLENFGEAEKAIESCLRIRPSWAKAWYRKGVIAMSQNKYLEASTSFQKALAIEPNNQEISNQLLRATNAESTSSTTNKSNGTKMDKQFIGTMLQMRAVSWDFKSWYATNRHCLNYWMPDSWDDSYNDIVASPTYQSRIAEVMRNLLPNFQIGQYPGSTVAKNISHLKQTIAKLIYPNEPVLNALYLATLMRTRFQKDDWSVVWTLSASTSSEQNTSARAIVVSRSQKMVVNFPGLVGTRGLDLEALKDHLATQLALFMNAEVNDVENEDYNEEYDAEAPISNDLHSSTADDHLKPKQRRVGIRRKENHNQEFAVSEMIIYACEDLTLVDTFSRQLYAAKTDFLKPIDKEKSKSDSKQDNGLEKILFQKQQSSKRQNDKEKNTVNSVEASGTKVQEFGSIADAQNMIDSQVNGTGSATSNFLTNIWRSNNSQTISDSHLRYWTRQAATICAVLALCIGVIYV